MPPRSRTALPVYLQISEALIRDIAAGRLADGERLPPERVFAARLGVSVGTLRKALADLEAQGRLARIQGSGNYVKAGGGTGIYAMFRLELPEGGGLPRARVVSVAELDKPADLPTFGQSDRATRIRRLRFLNETLVALEEIWLDLAVGRIDPAQLAEPLYRHYQNALGVRIVKAEDRVSIAPVPGWAPEGFPKAPGAIAGYVQRLSWAEAAAPVEYSRTWFDPDRAQYVQRMT
ncbi:MAG: GntR family transcriptional regulator [Rhodobacteraceae bacterium]|nr:MAG: GntR family transcriptional regulator [Paracoccaceae bacterium]